MKISKIIKEIIKNRDYFRTNISYSQEGEDLILDNIFAHKNSGFYVDIGAHHPVRLSNTKKFYDKGWNGINVDLVNIDKFNRKRPRDKNICAIVAKDSNQRDFFIFEDMALSTLDKEIAQERISDGKKLIETKKTQTKTLKEILDENSVKEIDFMSIDVEGAEIEILQSNDWNKYLPKIILVEIYGKLEEVMESSAYKLLLELNYHLVAKTSLTSIFRLKNDNI